MKKSDAMLEAIQEILSNAKKYSNQPLTDKLVAKKKAEAPVVGTEVEELEDEHVDGDEESEDEKAQVLAALAKLLG